MSDVPPTGPGDEPGGPAPDPWDAWRQWSPPSGGGADPGASAWDAWKSWDWDPTSARRFSGGAAAPAGCSTTVVKLIVFAIIALFLLSFVVGAFGDTEDLPADELIARIDSLPITGTRDQRPPDTSAGETATFPAAGEPAAVADAIAGVQAPTQRQSSGSSSYLLYEAATVVVQPTGSGTEVVVFDDNRAATRRFPLLIALPGWSGSLDDFDSRARSRGGIGGFRGGGGGFGK